MEKIFERQKEFQALISEPLPLSEFQKIRTTNIQIRRAIDELYEVLRELPYDISNYTKSKKVLSFNYTKVVEEIVDAQLFIINALNIIGIDSLGFEKECNKKQKENTLNFENKKKFRHKDDNFLIVIEGVDGVGKTEICKELSKKTGFPILTMPDMSNNKDIEEYSYFFRKIVSKLNNVYILDRFYPSSLVYGKYFNRAPLLDDLKTLYEQRDVFIFIIDADKPYRPDLFINDSTQWNDIRQLYLEQAKRNSWKIIHNDTTLENCTNEILVKLQF